MSKVREIAKELFNIINGMAQANIQHETVRWFWNRFFYPRAIKIIETKPENELKQAILLAHAHIDPYVKEISMAKMVIESEKLNPNPQVVQFIRSNKHIVDKEILEMLE